MTIAPARPAAPALPGKRRNRWAAPAAAAVVVVLTASAATVALAPPGRQSLPAPVATAQATPPSDAAGPLIAMADLLQPSAADASRGRYYYTHIESWSRADDQIIGFLIDTWRSDDGSTIQSERRTAEQSARTFDMAQIGVRDAFDSIEPLRTSFGADEGAESFIERHGPPPGDPMKLGRIIDSDNGGPPLTASCPPACGVTIPPMVFVDAVTSLYRETYLDREARAALLRLVAVQPGVQYLGEVIDRAGRKAIGVAVTQGGVRFSLLFDRGTGVLLASERAVPGFVLDDYSLYYRFERRDSLPTTAEQPTR